LGGGEGRVDAHDVEQVVDGVSDIVQRLGRRLRRRFEQKRRRRRQRRRRRLLPDAAADSVEFGQRRQLFDAVERLLDATVSERHFQRRRRGRRRRRRRRGRRRRRRRGRRRRRRLLLRRRRVQVQSWTLVRRGLRQGWRHDGGVGVSGVGGCGVATPARRGRSHTGICSKTFQSFQSFFHSLLVTHRNQLVTFIPVLHQAILYLIGSSYGSLGESLPRKDLNIVSLRCRANSTKLGLVLVLRKCQRATLIGPLPTNEVLHFDPKLEPFPYRSETICFSVDSTNPGTSTFSSGLLARIQRDSTTDRRLGESIFQLFLVMAVDWMREMQSLLEQTTNSVSNE